MVQFLLKHFVRPYQNYLYQTPIRGLRFVNGRSAKGKKKSDIPNFYFASDEPGSIYLDKVSQFACSVIDQSGGLPVRRFEQIFERLFIDEAQDLAGYDLDLVEHLLNSRVQVTLVGDVRQGTYKTNHSPRNTQFGGARILKKFEEWERAGLAKIEIEAHSHRCVQPICDLADSFYSELPAAISNNHTITGHDGVFAVQRSDIAAYLVAYSPQPLRLDRRNKNVPGCPLNFGEAKGKSFLRTLIFPHSKLLSVLKSGDVNELGNETYTRAKVYVGITRAAQSVAFVVPDGFSPHQIPVFDPGAIKKSDDG